jgi:glycosyltransferase involved in cell wall biosynthesis
VPEGDPRLPSVSVITVVKNGEQYLSEALSSILAQSLPPCEILVVDGHSTDRTAAIARAFAGVRYLRQPDEGLANARNLGIAAARGELIAFLDHDDLWAPEKLRTQARWMADDPELGYTTTLLRFVAEAGAAPRPTADGAAMHAPRPGCTPSALLARRELFDRIGRFDPAYAIGCDADWFTRARDQRVPAAVVPRVLVYKRLHRSNLSIDAALNRREMFRVARASITRTRLHQHADPARH